MACHYCKRERNYPCHNTRDMEDFAITGDDICLGRLASLGGGEKGLKYVCLNREDWAKKKQESTSGQEAQTR